MGRRRTKGQTRTADGLRNKHKRGGGGTEGAAIIADDDRFLDLAKNPMFREMGSRQRKVVVDNRFRQMLTDKRFEERDFRVDKRGRPVNKSTGDGYLKHLYELEPEEKEEKESSRNDKKDSEDENEVEEGESLGDEEQSSDESEDPGDGQEDEGEGEGGELPAIQLDLARGEGPSALSSSEEDEDEQADGGTGQVGEPDAEFGDVWAEMDKSVRRVEWASSRLAVCNMDWGKLTAEHLMLVLRSFKPAKGSICSVSIYLSDFGAEHLEEEKKHGPRLKLKPGKAEDLDERTKQAVRAYELDRLRYFYALCECDSVETASAIYEACDGVEYEASGMSFDIRFVPPEMTFEDIRLKERITEEELNDRVFSKPRRVDAHPLVCTNPKMSWDEVDPERRRTLKHAFEGEAKLDEFESLIAPASDEEDDEQQRTRYELLMDATRDGQEQESHTAADEDPESENVLNIEWDNGEKQKDEEDELGDRELTEEEEGESEDEEKGLGRGKTKKRTKFQSYLERKKQIKVERKSKEQEEKKKRKKSRKEETTEKVDEQPEGKSKDTNAEGHIEADSRFSCLFTDSAFAIDRTHAQYKGGDLAERQVRGKMKRRGFVAAGKEGEDNKDRDEGRRLVKRNKTVDLDEEDGPEEEEEPRKLVERLKKKQKQKRY